MKKKVLIITDKIKCLWIDEAIKKDNRSNHYDILTLGVNSEVGLYVNKEKYDQIESFEFIDVSSYAEAAQKQIRKYIPSFIYEFPRKEFSPNQSVLKFLDMSKFNLWWFMEMSEKGALRTPFVNWMYYLELIRNAILKEDYQEVWLELEDKVILNLLERNRNKLPQLKIITSLMTLKSQFAMANRNKGDFSPIRLLANTLGVQLRCFFRHLVLKIIGLNNKKILQKGSLFFFSFFPYFWSKSSKYGIVENFFKSVPEKIRTWAPIYYAVWLTLKPGELWRQQKNIRRDFKQKNIITLESYLGIKDFISIFILSIKYFVRVIKYRFILYGRIKEYYEGWDITNIVVAELNHSLVSPEVFKSVLIMKAAENIIKDVKPAAFIYRIEFQPHERAIVYAMRGKCLGIAFQHQAIARNHLQYFFPPDEIVRSYSGKNNPNNIPLPDKFLVTGEYPFEVLKNGGIPDKDISISGPVRFTKLVEYIKSRKTKSEIRKKYGFNADLHIFLIASPVVRNEMLNLILSLLQALKEIDKDYLFLFKSHPSFKHDKEIVDIINKFCPNMNYSFLADNINLNDYLFLSDAILLTGTTVGIEAICLGTMPILLENTSFFNLNPLLEVKNAYFSVANTKELKNAMLSIINNDGRINEIKANWPAAIKKLFYSLDGDPNERFNFILRNFVESKI